MLVGYDTSRSLYSILIFKPSYKAVNERVLSPVEGLPPSQFHSDLPLLFVRLLVVKEEHCNNANDQDEV